MRWLLSILCHLAVLLVALRWTHSASGFLVLGLGTALLLDRYLLHLLPSRIPVAWTKELSVRSAFFTLGALGAYLTRPGVVPFWEALYRGTTLTLAAALLEAFISMATTRRKRICLRAGTLCLVVLAVPYLLAIHPLHTVPKRTPAAFGLAFEDVRIPTADGQRLAGWLVPHPQARGNVIFCHGHGRNRGHVAGLLQTFHELRLNLLAFDFRGHGDSPGHTATFGHREVGDLGTVAAYLERRCPGQPLFLAGVSYGAAVILQALPRLPSVRGVWVEGCFSRLSDVSAHQFACVPAALRRPLLFGYNVLGLFDCGIWGPDVNPIDSLAGVNVPIYFCHGRADEFVPFAEGQAVYARYAGPKGHYWPEGASHYKVRQRCRAEYLRRLRCFLEERLAVTGVIPVISPASKIARRG